MTDKDRSRRVPVCGCGKTHRRGHPYTVREVRAALRMWEENERGPPLNTPTLDYMHELLRFMLRKVRRLRKKLKEIARENARLADENERWADELKQLKEAR